MSVATYRVLARSGSTTKSLAGIFGRFALMSVHVAPKSALRNTWPRLSLSRKFEKPENVAYTVDGFTGSNATCETERSGRPAETSVQVAGLPGMAGGGTFSFPLVVPTARVFVEAGAV